MVLIYVCVHLYCIVNLYLWVLMLQSLLSQLSQLCGIAEYHLTPYVKDIFEVVSQLVN
jgi:hypothetical protein